MTALLPCQSTADAAYEREVYAIAAERGHVDPDITQFQDAADEWEQRAAARELVA